MVRVSYLEIPILKSHPAHFKTSATDINHPRSSLSSSFQYLPQDQICEQEVTNMIAPKLQLDSVFRHFESWSCHNPRTVNQDVNLPNISISIDLRGCNSDGSLVSKVAEDEFCGDGRVDAFDRFNDGVDARFGASDEDDLRWVAVSEGDGDLGSNGVGAGAGDEN
jgi:hypothetical protein